MIKKRYLDVDVVTAARNRIKKKFAEGNKMRLSFSGGKDSLVLSHIILELIRAGEIDKSLLTVTFVDEEAMYDDVIEIVKKWRLMFMQEGVKFEWYCIPVKHYNCLNTMSMEETFVCWDPRKKDVWVRERPSFAITDDDFLIPYKDNYQLFWDRKAKAIGYTNIIGLRVSESIQRYKAIAALGNESDKFYPIYDMLDADVWLYCLKYNIELPIAYENLYRVGRQKNKLRISQFFSIDTASSLVSLGEMYPDLMERVTKREPNAYLCSLYWDTEMFGRTTNKRRKLEGDNIDNKDYRKLVMDIITSENPEHPELVKDCKSLIIKYSNCLDEKVWRRIHRVLVVGDPKGRELRAILTDCANRRWKIK